MLFSGCWMVRPPPPPPAIMRSCIERGFGRAVLLLEDPRPQPAAGAELGHLLPEVAVDVEVEGEAAGELVDVEPALERVVDVGLGDGQAVGHLLGGVAPDSRMW